jgi:mRNA interferase MazF
MAQFVKGDIVVVLFPFSDLSNAKKRPAFVVAKLNGQDVILCQITSQASHDNYSIALSTNDFSQGNLNRASNIRPNRLFTADQRIIAYQIGKARPEKIEEVITKIVGILTY